MKVEKLPSSFIRQHPAEAAKLLLLKDTNDGVYELIKFLTERIEKVLEHQQKIVRVQADVLETLRVMAQPKKWEYKIERYGGSGAIKGVVAKQKDPE